MPVRCDHSWVVICTQAKANFDFVTLRKTSEGKAHKLNGCSEKLAVFRRIPEADVLGNPVRARIKYRARFSASNPPIGGAAKFAAVLEMKPYPNAALESDCRFGNDVVGGHRDTPTLANAASISAISRAIGST